MRPTLILNRTQINESAFQSMADETMKEIRATGKRAVDAIKAVAPTGPRGKKRSKMSKLYGTVKTRTRLAAAGKREKVWKDGKRRWSFKVERIVVRVPFYGYFVDKGWSAKGARQIPGTGFVTNTIKRFAR